MIDNPVLTRFCDECLRPAANKFAELIGYPGSIATDGVGKGIPAMLGTTAEKLTRAEEWADADYAELIGRFGVHDIVGSDRDGRTLLTNIDCIALYRAIVWNDAAIKANPAFAPLVYKFARSPGA